MDEIQSQNQGWDSWWMARLGTAIDISVDRVINKPQTMYDPSQAYGVDANGNLYRLGQTNGQVTANVQTAYKPLGMSPTMWLLLAVGVVLVLEAK